MKQTRFCGVSVLAATMALASQALSQNSPASDRYIVTLYGGNAPDEVLRLHGLAARQIYTHVANGFAADIPPGRLVALANDPRVENITVDQQVFAFGKPTPPPPPTPSQQVPAGVARIAARSVSQTGAGVGVAILDTGIDFNHRDLSNNLGAASFVSSGFEYTDSALDDEGHGTHVSGIVAATDNQIDVVGVAPRATLYAVKVLDNTGSGYDSDIISGLDWVLANAAQVNPKIKVINMSLGRSASSDDSAMHTAIQKVVAAGVTVVVSAGNDSRYEIFQMVPAGFTEVIAVASTTAKKGTSTVSTFIEADTASFFTTDGAGIASSAPGEDQENIKYPRISSVGILSTLLGGGTTRMSGTSMAAPHVTGAVALLLEKTSGLTPAQIKAKLKSSAALKGTAPLNSPTSSYSFDQVREGVLNVPDLLAP